jgi:uncharacterized protein YuzE
MKISFFPDTDTLLVEFAEGEANDTRDLDENTLAEYDERGKLLAITMEHASERADLDTFIYQNPAHALS